jgi:hypothetical protein
MCQIIYKPAGAELDLQVLRSAKMGNKDGVGIMFATQDGRVSVHKDLMDINSVLALWDEFKHEDLAIHFRFSTGGRIDKENCHPFRILSKERDGRDLWMMHNGVLHEVNSTINFCDTYIFVRDYLGPILRKNPDLFDRDDFKELLEDTVGSYNKLLFMDGNGKVTIINKDSGSEKDGVWVSNKYSLNRNFREIDYDDEDGEIGYEEEPTFKVQLTEGEREDYIRDLAMAINESDQDRIDDLVEALGEEGEEIYDTLMVIQSDERREIATEPWETSTNFA